MRPLGYWKRVRDTFEEASSLSGSARDEFVAAMAAGDVRFTDLVARLLSIREGREPDWLAWSPRDGAHQSHRADLSGLRAGRYLLICPLGSGGMGEVYLGMRTDSALEQPVAVKVLARATPESLRLFERERAVLSTLIQPGVVRLLDSGQLGDHRPFLAMEFVEGIPITRYANERGFDVRARLRLALELLSIVGDAHRAGIAHLDLKPSNILVTPDGQPRVIDFGIARFLADGEGATRHFTSVYASPEVREGRRNPVRTSADVYSIGVVIHELLTGTLPRGGGPYTRASDAVRMVVADAEGVRPLGVVAVTSAMRRPARELARVLAGDLDAILERALAFDAAHRYPTTEALAADIRGYLQGLPVAARRRTVKYVVVRLLTRRPDAVVAAALVLAAAVATLVVPAMLSENAAADRALERVWEQHADTAARINSLK